MIEFRKYIGKRPRTDFEKKLWADYDAAQLRKKILQSLQTDSRKDDINKQQQQNKMGTKKKPTKATENRRQTLAALWDDTDPSEASNMLPAGEHTVRLNKIELKDDPKKGTAVFCEYEAIEGENEGQTVRQMYKLTDVAGAKAQGLAFLMRDLALLGYTDVPGKKLKKTLDTITEDQPMVIITVKENGVYTNAYLSGLADDVEAKDEDEEDDDEDEDDAPAPKKKAGKKKPADDEDEEDDDEEEEEEDDEDEDEEEEEEEAPKKKGKKKVVEEDDEEEEDEDEDEEEEEDDDDEEESEDEDEEEDEEEDEDEDEDEEEEAPKKKKKK